MSLQIHCSYHHYHVLKFRVKKYKNFLSGLLIFADLFLNMEGKKLGKTPLSIGQKHSVTCLCTLEVQKC